MCVCVCDLCLCVCVCVAVCVAVSLPCRVQQGRWKKSKKGAATQQTRHALTTHLSPKHCLPPMRCSSLCMRSSRLQEPTNAYQRHQQDTSLRHREERRYSTNDCERQRTVVRWMCLHPVTPNATAVAAHTRRAVWRRCSTGVVLGAAGATRAQARAVPRPLRGVWQGWKSSKVKSHKLPSMTLSRAQRSKGGAWR